MNKSIYILDAPVGTGKTTAIFNWMRENPNRKWLYVSPMLTEVEERVPEELAELEFEFPKPSYSPMTKTSSKSYGLLKLLKEEKNIAFTHSLFTQLSKEHLDCIKEVGYTLIIDEEVDFLEAYKGRYNSDDLVSLEEQGLIFIDEDNLGMAEWKWEDMKDNTVYAELKRLCDMKQLFCAKRSRKMLVTHLPIELLTSTEENILLTYLFDGSVMNSFLQLRDIQVLKLQDKYPEIVLQKSEREFKEEARKLITIASTPTTQKAKDLKGLSATWYSTTATKEQLKIVGNAIRSVSNKHKQENMLYTLPKSSNDRKVRTDQGKLITNPRCALHINTKNGDGYFLYSSARATNDYVGKSVMVHAYDRYPHVLTNGYLQDYGTPVNSDKFALSETIQWLWRSCIRKGEPVVFYFLSQRIEDLFISWLYSD